MRGPAWGSCYHRHHSLPRSRLQPTRWILAPVSTPGHFPLTPTLKLGPIDTIVLILYCMALAGIGAWAARRSKNTTDDYFLAGRSVPWLVTTASFLATCISALTFVGTPAEGYSSDFKYLFSNVGDIAATFFIASYFLPAFQKLNVTSIYELVAHRFGAPVRTACSGYFLVSRTLAATVRIVGIAKVVEVCSGGSLGFTTCVVAVVCTILAYTITGGGRAIAWTDLMQFFLLVFGALMALVYILSLVPGGFWGVVEAGKHAVKANGAVYNKFNFLDAFSSENVQTLLLIAVWGFFNSCAAYGCDQDMVQRLLSCNDPKRARWSLMLSGLVGIPINLLFLFIGVGLYAYVQTHPELIAGMTDNDHVFPRFIVTVLPEGLRGLLLAAVASAAMGSSDSALASLATAFTVDFYRPFIAKDATQANIVKASKFAYVFFGVLFIAFSVLFKDLDNLLWLAFRIVAFTYGPLLGVFLVAIMTDWKVAPRRILLMMFSFTAATFTLAVIAKIHCTPNGLTPLLTTLHIKPALSGTGLGTLLTTMHEKYWRLYIIFGALGVPFLSYFLRERNGTESKAS